MARTRNDSTGSTTPESKDKKIETVTFYKARNQASVIWDPSKDKALVEFGKSLIFTTSDPKLIEKLRSMGYKEEPPIIRAGETSGFVPSDMVGGEQINENDDQNI